MDNSLPIACSLDGDQARRRWHEWNALLDRRLTVDRSPERLTVSFPIGDDLMADQSVLVAAERRLRICRLGTREPGKRGGHHRPPRHRTSNGDDRANPSAFKSSPTARKKSSKTGYNTMHPAQNTP